jgi:uncharacterized protein YndB with AHSA1/START domain
MNATTNRHGSATVKRTSDTEMVITRKFDAPARLVFRAWTTPELVKRWWGFDTSQWLVCEIDFRVGGRWRFVTLEKDGKLEVGFHGEYREIEAPRRIVSTEVYEGLPGGTEEDGAVNTLTLDEKDGVTTMTTHVKMRLKEHMDGMIQSGMESGMQISYNRMEDLIAELRQAG